MPFLSIYFSRILGNKIYNEDNILIGKVLDFAISTKFENPKIIAVKVKTNKGTEIWSWDNFTMEKIKGQYYLVCKDTKNQEIGDLVLLKKVVLDRQIIDINGRKVVRVNDIRLVFLESGFYVVAVDIGMEGILRRLSMAKLLKKFGLSLTSKLVLWNDIETVYTSNDIVLTKEYNKLSTIHPSDLADIIEDFDVNTGMMIFSKLDNAKAADVLEELEDNAQINMLKTLSADKAADILEEMPADEVAEILDSLNELRAEELLSNMEKEAQDDVRELMQYNDKVIGSIMNTEFAAYKFDSTVQTIIDNIRNEKPEFDVINYIYILDEDDKLSGVMSLRDLIIAEPEKKLIDVMSKHLIYMEVSENVKDLFESFAKYNLFAMPIVDTEMNLVGSVSINDVLDELI